jgi:putative CocE/NonD family hydrolase
VALTLVVFVAGPFLLSLPGCGRKVEGGFYEEEDVAVPMRDGVILRADVRRPAADGKYPVLLFRTPYDKDEGDPDNELTFRHAVERGYALVVQDVRGRYASDGEYTPYINEGKDGYDTIEWAAAQPWSNGQVGTFGLSYPGAVQWLAAVESPPHLKAMVPAMCFSTLRQFIYFGGVFETAWASWVYKYMSPDTRVRNSLPGPQTIDEARAEWDRLGGDDVFQGWLPLMEMPYLEDTAPYYYEWIEHQPYDPWWNWGDLGGKYDRVAAAVLNLSGWYDESYGTQGAISNFQGLLGTRAGEEDPRTKMIIGPWIHGVDATGQAIAGDREFADSAKIDYDDVVLDWLDYYVRGIDNGVAQWSEVKVYNMGDDRWIEGDGWPLLTTQVPLYLGPPAPQGTVGTLSYEAAGQDGSSSFVSDPKNPVRDEFGTGFGAFDLRGLAGRPDVLTFETQPFAEDTEVIGNITAEIYLSSDVPDLDLYVKPLDVAPDGTAYNLEAAGHEVIRVSYRDKTMERKLLGPGEVVLLRFDNILTGNTFKAGHRLRICMMGSWFPTYARNLQTGLLESESSETRIADVRILHGATSPSRLVLSVIPRPQ